MSNARLVPCSLSEYHGDTSSVSHSGLELILEDPAEYEAERLSGNPKERKKHYEQGQSFEDALMRPGPCGGDMVIIPEEVLATNGARVGTKWEMFKARNRDKVLVKETDDLCKWIRAVQGHEEAKKLVETPGRLQETIYWTDDATGVECRIRMDKIFDGSNIILDLKTDISPCTLRDCEKSIMKWGYDRQAEFYRRGVFELYGVWPPFVFLFVSKAGMNNVMTIEMDDAWYPLAKIQNDRALARYARCKTRGIWRPENYGKTIKLGPPANRRDYTLEIEDGNE